MTATTDIERCTWSGCDRPITGRGAITDRDGHRYCKKHGDRLPQYLRRTRPTKGPGHKQPGRKQGGAKRRPRGGFPLALGGFQTGRLGNTVEYS